MAGVLPLAVVPSQADPDADNEAGPSDPSSRAQAFRHTSGIIPTLQYVVLYKYLVEQLKNDRSDKREHAKTR